MDKIRAFSSMFAYMQEEERIAEQCTSYQRRKFQVDLYCKCFQILPDSW